MTKYRSNCDKNSLGKTNKLEILNNLLPISKNLIICRITSAKIDPHAPIKAPIKLVSQPNNFLALFIVKPFDNIKQRSLFRSIKIIFKTIEIKINEIIKLITKKTATTITAISKRI